MLVELEKLKPNPMRDFTIDPIDPDIVATLKDSIQEHGFWGGVVCRQRADRTLEIGAGHHRIQAALEAGIMQADLFVRTDEVDDAEMVLLYATENGTQRGNTSTALAGTVASAVRFLTKMYLTGIAPEFGRDKKTNLKRRITQADEARRERSRRWMEVHEEFEAAHREGRPMRSEWSWEQQPRWEGHIT